MNCRPTRVPRCPVGTTARQHKANRSSPSQARGVKPERLTDESSRAGLSSTIDAVEPQVRGSRIEKQAG